MYLILNRALSWAITSFGNEFCLKKRSRLIKAFDNRFYVKFMQLEISLFLARKTLYIKRLGDRPTLYGLFLSPMVFLSVKFKLVYKSYFKSIPYKASIYGLFC